MDEHDRHDDEKFDEGEAGFGSAALFLAFIAIPWFSLRHLRYNCLSIDGAGSRWAASGPEIGTLSGDIQA